MPWGFVPGGMGTVTGMMADAAREAGADLRPASPVARIVVEDGRACGVVLESGEELRSRIVLSNADPKRTFLGLCDPADVPEEFAPGDRRIPLRRRQHEDQPGRRPSCPRSPARPAWARSTTG